ncbi:MAG: hypothetical protein JST22_04550 [Bacteroidetes bacterium]|nr:hypothetical protein [Bacteroidota bacterium]
MTVAKVKENIRQLEADAEKLKGNARLLSLLEIVDCCRCAATVYTSGNPLLCNVHLRAHRYPRTRYGFADFSFTGEEQE